MRIQIALRIMLPVLLLAGLWRGTFDGRRAWMLSMLAVGAVLLFAFLAARWDVTSYYLRFLYLAAFAAAAYRSRARTGRLPARRRSLRWATLLSSAAVLLVFSYLSAVALRGYLAPSGALQLAYPLRDAVYYVGGGGNSRFLNNHGAFEPEKYALDVVRLNACGRRSAGFALNDLEAYAIFGDTVYSPCAGTVLVAADGLPDLRPPSRDREHLAGNHVVIACHGVQLLLAHLQQGSVAVKPGAWVAEGDVLGRVGNSGNTSHPHLHLHAERGARPGEILTGEGVPVRFGGRFLVRNSVFTGR